MSNKIFFKCIRSKNFRSFGNQFIEIDLTQPSTLVCSDENGAGKSTGIIHALSFVLFDKPYQKGQKKSTLINSRNNKDCVVETEFTAKGSVWCVSRGIKPNFLKIVKDGVTIENEASLKDPQKYLEQVVLGFDEKVLFNIALLGRDKFVSFAEMSAGEMRNFVEVLLDQGIFSVMNDITKEDLKATNRKIEDLSSDIRVNASKISSSLRVIELIKDTIKGKQLSNATAIEEIEQEIVSFSNKVEELEPQLPILRSAVAGAQSIVDSEDADIRAIDTKISELNVSTYRDAVSKINNLSSQFKTRLDMLNAQRKAFMDKNSCPSCEQPIAEEKKHEYCIKVDPEILKIENGRTELSAKLLASQSDLEDKEHRLEILRAERNNFKSSKPELVAAKAKLTALETDIRNIQNQISECLRKKTRLQTNSDATKDEAQLLVEEETLSGLNSTALALDLKEKQLHTHRNTIQSLLVFLKDDGVKGKIASQYLPFLNQKTNEYLDALNLWVNIEFDNEFGVTMSAPDRKGQEIAALSTGQMRRIDIAILLAWRDIAKLKASVDTNILIMDETLENLSAQGVADFVDMFGTKCSDTSLFVMTQRNQEFSEFFDRTLHFSLKDGFSIMKEY